MTKPGWGRMNSDQSWVPMARDMDRALARAGMTTHEAALMQYVREFSWGEANRQSKRKKGEPWPDPLAVAWSPAEIARRIGEKPVRVSEAKASLVKSKMLIETPAGLLINKNAHQWVTAAGKPRLTDAAIAYAMAAWPQPETAEVDPETIRKSVASPSGNPDVRHTEIRMESSGNPDNAIRKSVSNHPEIRMAPYKERGRVDSETLGDIETTYGGREASPGSNAQPQKPTDPRLATLIDTAEGIMDPGDNAPRWIAEQVKAFGIDNVEAAVRRANSEETMRYPRGWMLSLLEKWKREGTSHAPKEEYVPPEHRLYVMKFPPRPLNGPLLQMARTGQPW